MSEHADEFEGRWANGVPDLYVMQNEFGLIKIGRSAHVEKRRNHLSRALRCRIEIVAIAPEAGDMEEHFHSALDRHRLAYEWFCGSDQSRADIVKEMLLDGLAEPWPFEIDRERAKAWLDRFIDKQGDAAARKSRLRELNYFKGLVSGKSGEKCQLGNRSYDLQLWRLICEEHEPHLRPTFEPLRGGGHDAILIDLRSKKVGRIPDYTTVLADALMVWPEAKRPKVWTLCIKGSTPAFTCAVLGLAAHWGINVSKMS